MRTVRLLRHAVLAAKLVDVLRVVGDGLATELQQVLIPEDEPGQTDGRGETCRTSAAVLRFFFLLRPAP